MNTVEPFTSANGTSFCSFTSGGTYEGARKRVIDLRMNPKRGRRKWD